jgi:ABC-type multidrug transport system fused ATPase/permease subunit
MPAGTRRTTSATYPIWQVRDAPPHQRDVVFDSVSFIYPRSADSSTPAGDGDGGGGGGGGGGDGGGDGVSGVSNLSLRIAPGGSVALIGPSGGGKSTCARLLCRLFDVSGGAVRVCGWDVRAVAVASLRSVVACVTQVR